MCFDLATEELRIAHLLRVDQEGCAIAAVEEEGDLEWLTGDAAFFNIDQFGPGDLIAHVASGRAHGDPCCINDDFTPLGPGKPGPSGTENRGSPTNQQQSDESFAAASKQASTARPERPNAGERRHYPQHDPEAVAGAKDEWFCATRRIGGGLLGVPH